ncbi:MAG: hypothetical protein K2H01_01935 [Ruminococcus sp.]|nr:hypothetical protein [Ruminococcus sp.]
MEENYNIDEEIPVPDSIKKGRGLNECVHIFKDNPEAHIGSGFLLNRDGLFISAAHNFKNKENTFFAVYDSKRYEIIEILNEYKKRDSYTEEDHECKDLYIGILKNFNPSRDFNPGILSKENTNCDELRVEGYNSFQEAPFHRYQYENTELYHKLLRATKPNDNLILIGLRNSRENVLPFYIPNSKKYGGLSGGPVFIGKQIYGCFIGDVFITSPYIICKLKEMRTQL